VIVTNPEDAELMAYPDRNGLSLRTMFRSRPLHVIPIGSNIELAPPTGYDRSAWRGLIGVRPDETLLGYFGFLNKSKGIETLLSALDILLSRGRRVKLLMIGGTFGDSDSTNVSYGKGIIELVEHSSYRDAVLWTGFVNNERVSASLLASDICVLPFDEGVSLRHGTLMAAIAHGLPIVTTSRLQLDDRDVSIPCGLPSLNGKVALVPPQRPESLATAIERLMILTDERNDLALKVQQLAPAFTWDKIATDTLTVYSALVEPR
jgi:glycosyltransferase involved in cell wall biosynthesis